MDRKNAGKVALITGSGRRRIGNSIARSLAKSGYSIALHYHSSGAAAKECVQEMRAAGVRCEAFQADVAVESEVDQMFDAALQHFGRLDALVATASIWETIPLESVTADDLLRNFLTLTFSMYCSFSGVFRS